MTSNRLLSCVVFICDSGKNGDNPAVFFFFFLKKQQNLLETLWEKKCLLPLWVKHLSISFSADSHQFVSVLISDVWYRSGKHVPAGPTLRLFPSDMAHVFSGQTAGPHSPFVPEDHRKLGLEGFREVSGVDLGLTCVNTKASGPRRGQSFLVP